MNETELHTAIAQARRQLKAGEGAALDVLLRAHAASADELVEQLRKVGGVGVLMDERGYRPDFDLLDGEVCRAWRCAVVRNGSSAPWLAAEDPWDENLTQKVSRRIGQAVNPAAVTRSLLNTWLAEAANGVAGIGEMPLEAAISRDDADGPIVDFVDAAMRAGFDGGASDIHFECNRTGVTVKHRLDGVMKPFARMEGTQQAQEVISRVKVLAQLDITERRLPQDGRFRARFGERAVDLRVSIMPSVFGEDAVLRLLDKAQLRTTQESAVSLGLLGFDDGRARLIRELSSQPSGMLLVTGPTGSGKTTTVYAALSEINNGQEKIITIEDPVEYELQGVLQIPVNERKGLTFAKGLRSILRHDPDRILVGEIRDAETAEIAVQSALTGHVVFTTVHANSVADIIGRFRHFGLDMFGFMSSLNGVVVQRLLRRLCERCAAWRAPDAEELRWLAAQGQGGAARVPKAVGCTHCHETGFHGRFVVAEVHLIDDAFRDDVTNGAALTVLRKHAVDHGVESLAVQAARRIVEGVTTTEEVKRVVGSL